MKRKPLPHQGLLRERFAQQMSRAALAEKAGVTQKTIWEHETRGGWVRMDNAAAIASALGKNVFDVYDDSAVIG